MVIGLYYDYLITLYVICCIHCNLALKEDIKMSVNNIKSIATSARYVVDDARLVWSALHNVFAVYKPASIHVLSLRDTIIRSLCHDLNNMYTRPLAKHVAIKGSTTGPMDVVVHPSYADHPLVVGPRYQPIDFRIGFANHLQQDSSGVLVCGLNKGTSLIHKIKASKPTATYKVKGMLGQATDNYFKTGKIVEKSSYRHVTRGAIDKLCASMQSSHQRKMFELCGVDIQSQAAYEMAVKGLIRPTDPNIPMIYAIKCTAFTPPEFMLEIVCINEYEMYLRNIISELGMQLHSTATCTQIQCIRYGLFDIELALLKKFWDLQNIVDNMQSCKEILMKNKYLLKQKSPVLIEHTA